MFVDMVLGCTIFACINKNIRLLMLRLCWWDKFSKKKIFMKKMILLLGVLCVALCSVASYAQCTQPNEMEVRIEVLPDEYTASETTWLLFDADNNVLANGSDQSQTLCLPADACLRFEITDQYGDGIQTPGYCQLYYNNELQYDFANFGHFMEVAFGACTAGSSCFFAIEPTLNTPLTAPQPDTWYSLTPVQSGQYRISTCGLGNACSASVWVYTYCMGLPWNDSPSGTLYFSSTGCENGAVVNAVLQAGETYYIRIGDMANICENQALMWQIDYLGAVTGCTDPTACNYNPIATQNTPDACLYAPNADCPDVPDLMVVREDILNSLSVTTTNGDDVCSVAEGCVTGYGTRTVVTFTMHIKNIGTRDYHIGSTPGAPTNPSDQFEFSPCHGHWHYKGYAEYLLFDQQGRQLPAGFKNGFCVMDIECSGGGIGKYGCGDQGITAGCGDIYGAGTGCQWIDITDVPDGLYTLVTRTNWDNSPDMEGNYEIDLTNNWAAICLNIHRLGTQTFADIVPDCWSYSDCSGNVYGSAQADCEGTCNGNAKIGDIDHNGSLQGSDVLSYIQQILDANGATVTTCHDVNADGQVNVTDAALVNACVMQDSGLHTDPVGGGSHNHCTLPALAITNPNDTIEWSIAQINHTERYFDIAVRNPLAYVLGYQLQISGVEILGIVNILDQPSYNIDLLYNLSGHTIGFSTTETPIDRYLTPHSVIRVYYTNFTANEVCVTPLTVINNYYEQTIPIALNNCVSVSDITASNQLQNTLHATLIPNPMNSTALLTFDNAEQQSYQLQLFSSNGQLMQTYHTTTQQISIERRQLPAGIYYYQLMGSKGTSNGKLAVE